MALGAWRWFAATLIALTACDASPPARKQPVGYKEARGKSANSAANSATRPSWRSAKPPESGVRIRYAPTGGDATPDQYERAAQVVRRRLAALKLGYFAVTVEGGNLVVDLPLPSTPPIDELKDLITREGRVEFKRVDDDSEWLSAADGDSDSAGIAIEFESAPLGRGRRERRAFATIRSRGLEHRQSLRDFKRWAKTRAVDDEHEVGFEALYDDGSRNRSQTGWRSYYLWRKLELDSTSITGAKAAPRDGGWSVDVEFNRNGGERLRALTSDNVQRRMAIIADGVILSAPIIVDTISAGRASITMDGPKVEQEKQARTLELMLLAGALPFPLAPESEALFGR